MKVPTQDWRLDHYRAGQFRVKPPPVPHTLWSTADWIQFIESYGTWIDPPDTIKN